MPGTTQAVASFPETVKRDEKQPQSRGLAWDKRVPGRIGRLGRLRAGGEVPAKVERGEDWPL